MATDGASPSELHPAEVPPGGEAQLTEVLKSESEDEEDTDEEAPPAISDSALHFMQQMVDALVVRDAYAIWFEQGGLQREEQMLQNVQAQAAAAQDAKLLEICTEAIRFRDVVHTAWQLSDDDAEHGLLGMCRTAIQQCDDVDVEAFLEVHHLIRGIYGGPRTHPTKERFWKAVRRQLRNKNFANELAGLL